MDFGEIRWITLCVLIVESAVAASATAPRASTAKRPMGRPLFTVADLPQRTRDVVYRF
jgi:hypothetical protein